MRRGCYPGTFDPPTWAHLAIAEATVEAAKLDLLDFVLSHDPLGKPDATAIEARLSVLEQVRRSRPWMGVRAVDATLIADLAAGYDVLVVGADKWTQIVDPAWYADAEAGRDEAVAALPTEVLVVPRPGHPVPPRARRLELGPGYGEISSRKVRSGERLDWMLPEAAATRLWSPVSRLR